ncbi:glycosyl hydrolase family 18 protein [uncultured Aquimarina sp.]|uniref:glycosyl hydrolase family 18 protein n=1 Tax=uncultured Aquimarina sp. TaxID=575652 RepID=UPI00260B286D|nr:glycosyl hydrolase family 18 protein [uncultured Aquimarina sp.]
MKKLFTLIFSLSLLVSCNVNNKSKENDENPLSPNDSIRFISQRHLQNQKLEDYNLKTEEQWDSLNTVSHKKVLHKKGKVHSDIRTFGWHLYSNGSSYKNYNFSMLWGLSYFSYALQPETGSYKSIHQWKTTSLIDSAKAKGCKVFFSVSNFGRKNNTTFLRNQKAQKTLIDSLSSLLALRSADGINIDFEGVPKKDKEYFTKFIIEISKSLKQDNPNYMVSLCLYAIDWNDIFDINAIDPYIDFYTLMGYDYYGSFSKTTGPVTPFKKSKKFGNGLETSVNYYKNKGVHFNKLIVGLPYYGAEWYTKKPEIGAVVTRFKSHPRYQSIRELYIDSLKIPIQFDPKSSSSYLIVKDNNKEYRQIFFEDVKSLSIKYDWIKNNKIGGVGIWALGYDDGYSELWDLLTEKFSK